mgnify:FL=1
MLCAILAAGVYFKVGDLITFSLVMLALMALASATHDVSIDGFYLDVLDKEQQSFFVGVRSAAYKMALLFATGGMVFLAGNLEKQFGLHTGWGVAFAVTSAVLGVTALFHACYLPHINGIKARKEQSAGEVLPAHSQVVTITGACSGSAGMTAASPSERTTPLSEVADEEADLQRDSNDLSKRKLTPKEFLRAITSYFQQPAAAAIVCYILLFRLGDALMLKQATNFLQDPLAKGGMALSVADIGVLYGTVGVIFLVIGGIVGGLILSRDGLAKWFWPLALFQNSAIILYFLLAFFRPALPWLYVANSIEQFAYGLGVSAYMVFLLATVRNEYKAAHYAVATGLMTLGMLIPGTLSGYLYEALGYANFFLASFLLSIPGMITIFFLPYWRQDEKRVPAH